MNKSGGAYPSRWIEKGRAEVKGILLKLYLCILSTLSCWHASESLAQSIQYNHPPTGYSVGVLFEGNFPEIGDAYLHNWWYPPDSETSGAEVYRNALQDHFPTICAGGGMLIADMWDEIPDFSMIDDEMAWALANNYRIKYTFLSAYIKKDPPDYTQSWIEKIGDVNLRRQIVFERIETILKRYPQVEYWNFANEITDNTEWNELLAWTDAEIVAFISLFARQFAPDAKIGINHYNIIEYESNRSDYIQLHKDALALGADLDYIGIEGHLDRQGFSETVRRIRTAIDELVAQIGIPKVHITEFDIGAPFDPATNTWIVDPDAPYEGFDNFWEWQGWAYRAAVDEFRNHPAVEHISLAEIDDGLMSWNPYAGYLRGIQLDDTEINPKPNYDTVAPLLLDYMQCPQALFTASSYSGKAPVSIDFNAARSFKRNGAIVSYGWHFDDGTNGSGSTVSHHFASAGNYDVTLTVSDNEGLTGTQSSRIRITGVDTIGPFIDDVTAPDTGTVKITFNEALDPVSAADTDSYSITRGVLVNSAVLGPDQVTVTLTVSTMTNVTHTVTVKDVRDTSGNFLAPASQMSFTPAKVVTILPEADATIKAAGESSVNFGSDNTLSSRYPWNQYHRRAFIRFDIGGIDPGRILHARLRLYLTHYEDADLTDENILLIRQTADEWGEMNITWDNAPAPGMTIASKSGIMAGQPNIWLELDVADYVRSQADSKVSFYLNVIEKEYDWMDFSSREGSHPPELVIGYTPAHIPANRTPVEVFLMLLFSP
jgi:PKD repeat protein